MLAEVAEQLEPQRGQVDALAVNKRLPALGIKQVVLGETQLLKSATA